ncbi:STE3-domain-containing protein [Ramaria rubella]|nr:STE3-domain-containing protein [Ramaria rubella]
MHMLHPEFPVAAFISIPLVLCSLPSHIRAGSVCTLALIAWLAIVSTIRGVNSLVWAGNVDVRLLVWCDITTKIIVGFTYAVPAAAVCVLRHLEQVSSTRYARTTKSDKRRRQKIEVAMCFGLPMIGMALHYVVQGHRFDIIEDFGCNPTVYFSLAAIMILSIPPFFLSLVSFVYAALALRNFLQRRVEFAAHLRNSQSSISSSRYFRLMALAVIEMIWDSGVNAYLIEFNSSTGLRPWISWANVHSNFSRVAQFPTILLPPSYLNQLVLQWWVVPISCILFFVFFAFGEEAMSDYRAAIQWVRRVVLRQRLNPSRSFGVSSVLPVHRPNVNITWADLSDTTAGHDVKNWEDLSLKMPYIQSPIESLPHYANEDPRSSQDSQSSRSSPPPSPFQSEQHATAPKSESSITISARTTLHCMPAEVPLLLEPQPPVTNQVPVSHYSWCPSSRSASIAGASLLPTRPSTDLGISVSPAYRPDVTLDSSYHEKAFFSSAPFGPNLISCPSPAHLPGTDGVRFNVEKLVR